MVSHQCWCCRYSNKSPGKAKSQRLNIKRFSSFLDQALGGSYDVRCGITRSEKSTIHTFDENLDILIDPKLIRAFTIICNNYNCMSIK
jgi:hypothetical protein